MLKKRAIISVQTDLNDFIDFDDLNYLIALFLSFIAKSNTILFFLILYNGQCK
jgi:hypothetical protein